jgi:DNA-binding NarL/FixJ family response regulator
MATPVWQLKLSRREAEILDCVREGLSNKQIGRKLGISPTTVKTHLERIFDKLQVRTRLQAAMKGTS